MRALFIFLLTALVFACKKPSDQHLLQTRWNFTGTDIRSLEKIASEYRSAYGVDGFKQVFAASKFILRKDETFDLCLFQNYRHGRWKQRNGSLVLWTQPAGDSIVIHIDTLAPGHLQLSIDTVNFSKLGRFVMPFPGIAFYDRKNIARFTLQRDGQVYKDPREDPYSKENNGWRIRPSSPETQAQIHQRMLQLVDFHLLMFEDAIAHDKKVITYNWFSSPLIVANNGLALKNYKKIQTDWQEYFYDSTQAREGFRMLSAAFDKKMTFPQDMQDPFKRSINMLTQYRRNLQ